MASSARLSALCVDRRELARELGDVPPAHGLHREPEPYPGMVLHPIPGPPAPSAGVTAVPIGPEGLDEYLQVCVAQGFPPDVAEGLFPPSFAVDPDVRLFLGGLEGQLVDTAVAIRSSEASGVYAVGTVPSARRRGVGTALTWAAMAAGRAWGHNTIVLQSSPMGLSMYTAVGFRTVAPYTTFSEPQPVETP